MFSPSQYGHSTNAGLVGAYHPLWVGFPETDSALLLVRYTTLCPQEHTAPFFFLNEPCLVLGVLPPFRVARLGFVAQLCTALFTRRY